MTPVVVTSHEPWGETVHIPSCPDAHDGIPSVLGEADGWLHRCIDVTPVVVVTAGVSVDPPERNGGRGRGRGVAESGVEPRWVKTDGEFAVYAPGGRTGDVVRVTARSGRVSEVTLGESVGRFLFAPAGRDEERRGFRWVQYDGEWLVVGPAAAVGDTITISKRDGSTVEAVVTARLADGLYRVERTGARRGGRTLPDVPAGHYAIESTGENDLVFYRVDRPTDGEWAGRVFVKRIVGGRPDERVPFEQVPGILARIVAAGVDEARALYGREIGRCAICNRTLTDEESRRAGIGPDCLARL